MKYQEVVEWLKSYKKKYERIVYLRGMMTAVRAISYEEKLGSMKTLNDYIDEVTQLSNELAVIEQAIDNIPDHYPRLVLGYKYLQYRSFEDIAEILNYSTMNISRLHKKGIKMLCDVM